MSDDINKDKEIKTILLGDAGVGKTNIINRVTGKKFNDDEKSTEAASFSVKIITINNKKYEIDLWDTIGQELYRQLNKLFFNNSKIVIFVYDITKKETFKSLEGWVNDVEEKLGPDVVKGVIANKSDLYLDEQVEENEGREFSDSINAKFLTFSAKNDITKKIEDYLTNLVEEFLLLNRQKSNERFTLTRESVLENKKNSCCK